jgi:hypothetical protein
MNDELKIPAKWSRSQRAMIHYQKGTQEVSAFRL